MLPHAMLISIAWSGALCVRLVGPAVSLSVLCQHRLAHDGRRPARCPCGQVNSCANVDSLAFPCKNGIVRRADKSIVQRLLCSSCGASNERGRSSAV